MSNIPSPLKRKTKSTINPTVWCPLVGEGNLFWEKRLGTEAEESRISLFFFFFINAELSLKFGHGGEEAPISQIPWIHCPSSASKLDKSGCRQCCQSKLTRTKTERTFDRLSK